MAKFFRLSDRTARARHSVATAACSAEFAVSDRYKTRLAGRSEQRQKTQPGNAGTPTWFGLTCFTVMVLALSFIFAWMRLKSESLWSAALLHASHNLYVQSIFTPLTHKSGNTAWFFDEFGVVLPIITIVFAIFFWSRRGQLQPIVPQPTGQPLAVTG